MVIRDVGSESISPLMTARRGELTEGEIRSSAYVVHDPKDMTDWRDVDIAPNDAAMGVLMVAKCSSKSEKSSDRSFCHASPS